VWRVLGSGTFRSADGVEVSSFERLGLKRHRGARTKKARPLVWKSSGRAIQARFYAELTLLNWSGKPGTLRRNMIFDYALLQETLRHGKLYFTQLKNINLTQQY